MGFPYINIHKYRKITDDEPAELQLSLFAGKQSRKIKFISYQCRGQSMSKYKCLDAAILNLQHTIQVEILDIFSNIARMMPVKIEIINIKKKCTKFSAK